MVKRDVINAESCYQENGEEVRRQEGHAQRSGEESLREEELRQEDDGEEVCGQEGRRKEVGRQARASQAQESDANADLWIVGYVASRLVGLRVQTYRLIRRGCRRVGLARSACSCLRFKSA